MFMLHMNDPYLTVTIVAPTKGMKPTKFARRLRNGELRNTVSTPYIEIGDNEFASSVF